MPWRHSHAARACAELIREWHVRYGIEHRPPNMGDEAFARYSERVHAFRDADLSSLEAQEQIAHEQRSGVFEWFYVTPVPRDLWARVCRICASPDDLPPGHLGDAANRILDSPRSGDLEEEPSGRAHADEPESRDRLLERASAFYGAIVGELPAGLGGGNALLSCSLERHHLRGSVDRAGAEHAPPGVTLLTPEALGFRIVAQEERADDLIDLLRKGALVVTSAIGGPSSS